MSDGHWSDETLQCIKDPTAATPFLPLIGVIAGKPKQFLTTFLKVSFIGITTVVVVLFLIGAIVLAMFIKQRPYEGECIIEYV